MRPNQLQRARATSLPSREDMLQRSPSVQQFWDDNTELFSEAWHEWEASEQTNLLPLNDALLDSRLREAVTQAWQDPSKEKAVRELLHEVAPGVFSFQLFAPEKLAILRDFLTKAADAEIPLRPPYGIVLNRGGAMLDPRSEGYLAAPEFQHFYRSLLDNYMRPIARLLFPEVTGYDTQTFGFSIQYQPNKDTSLRMHSDASSVTLNINLNLPDEHFTGSGVNFYDANTGKMVEQVFEPGIALIHRGYVPHAAQPIISGERTNMVLWLYGDNGQIPMQGINNTQHDAKQRWTTPTANFDRYAPF